MRTREEIVESSLQKVMKIINDMKCSNSFDDVVREIKITNKLSLKVECERSDVVEVMGTALFFEIYAVKNNKEVDCASVETYGDIEGEVKYLLNCYV